MSKIKFFTGPNCSGCGTVKRHIDAKEISFLFDYIDVVNEARLAHQMAIRSLPTIVDGDNYYIGTTDCNKFIKELG